MKKITIALLSLISIGSFSQTPCSPSGLPVTLQNGLVGYYPFCNDANDQSGNNFNGTVYGATLTNDRFGTSNNAYLFDGNNYYIALGSSFDLLPRSVCFWFNALLIDATGRFIYCSDNSALVNGLTNYGVTIDNSMDSWWSTVSTVNHFAPITQNVWHQAVITVDSAVTNKYIDGQLIFTDSIPSFLSSASGVGYAVLGTSRFTTNGFFQGTIDDVMIYNRVLAQSEVTLLFSNNPMAVSLLSNNDFISFFPNPATNELTIENGELKIKEIEIYSSLGEKVFSQPQTTNHKPQTIDVSQLPSGIYFITVTDQAGNKVTKKVMKM